MVLVGLAVAVLGFVISFASLGVASDVTTRMVMVLAGIAISLFGILGIVSKAYLKDAIWKK